MPHWKDHLNSTLLGAYSLFDDATEGFKEIDGVIINTAHEDHILGGSGKQKVFVARTSLGKPLRLNNVMSNQIALISGSKNPAKWLNIPVTFYVDEKVKLGRDTVEAIRVKARVKVVRDYAIEKQHLQACTTLEELQTAYLSIDRSAQQALVLLKDEMKAKLTPKNE